MATDSIAGLFTDPYTALQQQSAATDQRASQFAQMTPMQQAQYGIYGGASRLGGGLAGLMGVEDPQMKLQAARQQAIRGMDPTDPQSIAQAAQKLMQIDPAGAAQLAQLAREAAAKGAETGLKTAQAKKAEQYQQASTAAERNRGIISSVETTLAENPNAQLTPAQVAQLRWTVAQETKAKTFQDPDSGKLITIEPIDLNKAAPNIAKYLESTGTTTGGPKVTTTQVSEPKLGEGVIKEVAATDEGIVKVGTAENKIKMLTPAIKNLNLGLIANYEREGQAFLGQETPDAKKFKELRRAVAEQANNLLLLAKGTQTEGDAQRARDQIVDDNTWKNKNLLEDAFTGLQTTLADTQRALRIKRETLTSKGRSPAPVNPADVAPNKSPLSGANPQLQPATTPSGATHRYNPTTGRVEAL